MVVPFSLSLFALDLTGTWNAKVELGTKIESTVDYEGQSSGTLTATKK
jgi:hypothetical protein